MFASWCLLMRHIFIKNITNQLLLKGEKLSRHFFNIKKQTNITYIQNHKKMTMKNEIHIFFIIIMIDPFLNKF